MSSHSSEILRGIPSHSSASLIERPSYSSRRAQHGVGSISCEFSSNSYFLLLSITVLLGTQNIPSLSLSLPTPSHSERFLPGLKTEEVPYALLCSQKRLTCVRVDGYFSQLTVFDCRDPIDKYPIDWEDWELPRIPYPKMVLFYETKKIKLSPEPPTVDNTKELVPIKPKSSIHDVLALLAKVDETLGVFAKPTPLEESEFREAVLRECKSRWQSALAATIVDEAVVAAAAALESVPVAVPVEDPTEMEDAAAAVVESVVSTVVDQEPTVVDDTTAAGDATELLSTAPAGATEETATDAMLEPVLATVTAQDTMAVEETIDEPTEEQSMDGPLVVDETTAAAALESAVTAVADQNSTTIGETSSHMSEMLSFIESLPVRDERRAAEDAAEVLTAPVEGPIEETAIAPMEEDAIEIAPDEEAAPVELVAAPPPMNYRRALSIVCHQYADKIYATAEGVMERELQYLKLDNCKMDGDGDGEHCEQR